MKQDINLGAVANDGTGDSLRAAGEKINENFDEVYDAMVPAGGTAGQALVKTTGADFDFDWADVEAGGGGASAEPAKGVVLTRVGNLAVGANATVAVPFTAEVIDEDNYWSAAAPTVITFAKAGWYLCTFNYNRAATGPDQFDDVRFAVNNVVVETGRQWWPANYSDSTRSTAFLHKFAAGDTLEMRVTSFGPAGTFNGIRFAASPLGGSQGERGLPGGPEELLANVKLTAEGTFPVIDTTGFRSVRIVFNLKKGGANGDITAATFRFNGANAGYYTKNMYSAGGGSGVGSDGHALNAAQGAFALISTRSGNTKLSAGGEVVITGLDSATLNKNWTASNAAYRELDNSVFNYTIRGFWDNIAVVNSIAIQETFAVDSSIQVFGVRANAIPQARGDLIAGDIVLLEERVISAPVAQVDFVGLITSVYRDYEIEISDLQTSGNNQLFMRYSQDNGATFDETGKYTSSGVVWNEGNFGAQSNEGGGLTRFRLSGTDFKAGSAAACLAVTLFNPLSTTGQKGLIVHASGQASDGGTYNRIVGGRYDSNNAVNAFRIYPQAGTINSAIIRVYGKRKTTASANVSVTAGAAFPDGPAVGARFYRTDRKIEYVWDGARWLSTQLFSLNVPVETAATSDAESFAPVPFAGVYSIWLDRLDGAFFRTAAGEWDVRLIRRDVANTGVVIAVLDGSGDPANTWVSRSAEINAALDATARVLVLGSQEVSGAAAFYGAATLHYRLIG